MVRHIKQLVKKMLRKHNRELICLHDTRAFGYDLKYDLRVVINNEFPMCLDIGANEGQTIELLEDAFNKPTIHAFEPVNSTFNILKSKDFGSNISLYRYALGRENEEKEFIKYDRSYLNSFLAMEQCHENPVRDAEIIGKERVEIKTVDWFLQNYSIPSVDLLKSDTQGFDLEVLLGAEKSFSGGVVQNVLVELNFIKIYCNQSPALDIIAYLSKYGLFLVDFYEKVYRGNRLAWCTALFSKGQVACDALAN